MKLRTLFLLIPLCLQTSCNRSETVLSFTCDPDYAVDGSWVYIYRLRENDYHIADSCQVKDGSFRFRFDVPFEERYTLLLPASRVKLKDIVLRPEERYELHIPAPNRFKRTYVLAEALEQSPATRAYFYQEQEHLDAAAIFRSVRAIRDSIDAEANPAAWNRWNDSLESARYAHRIGVRQRLLDDSLILTSPYTCYQLLLGYERSMPEFDSVLLAMTRRFPDYPLFRTISALPPQSREGWRNEARIKALLGLPAPPPYVEPVKDTIPEPVGIVPIRMGDSCSDLSFHTTEGIVRPLDTIASDLVLLDFWASWCQPCRNEIKQSIRGLAERHAGRLTVCSVSIDRDTAQWKKAIEELGIAHFTHYCLKQPHADYKRTLARFGFSAIPYTVLLNKQRKIVAINLHGDRLSEAIEQALAE